MQNGHQHTKKWLLRISANVTDGTYIDSICVCSSKYCQMPTRTSEALNARKLDTRIPLYECNYVLINVAAAFPSAAAQGKGWNRMALTVAKPEQQSPEHHGWLLYLKLFPETIVGIRSEVSVLPTCLGNLPWNPHHRTGLPSLRVQYGWLAPGPWLTSK